MVLGAQAPGRVGRRRITSGGPRERPSFCFPPRMRAVELRPPDPPLGDELVELRPWLDRDVPAIVAACNDPETARWTTVPSPYTEEDARAWLERCETAWSEGAAPLAVVERASGELAAAITLWLHGRTGELGYWAAPEYRGRGYVPRAVRLSAAGRSTSSTLPRMQLGTFPGNDRVGARRREVRLHPGGRAARVDGAARRAPRRDDVVAPTRRPRVEPRAGARAAGA